MVDWVKGFIIPIIEVTFLIGIIGYISFIIGKALYNAWTKAGKFIWRYKFRKKPYPEKTVKWVLDCMEKGIGWYDAKKILLTKGYTNDMMYETLWIYDQIINEFNNQKGGTNGRKHQRSDSKDESKPAEFPTI